MTQWVGSVERGRARGPTGIVRAWVGVLVGPRQFFDRAVEPADQAPGLIFFVSVVGIAEASRYALQDGVVPAVASQPLVTVALALLLTMLLIAPLGLHLLAALQTVLLWPITEDCGGVSETVQVLAYATAPCVFAGFPVPLLRVLCASYGAGLLVVGLATVHDIDYLEAAVAGAIPATLVFGVAFRGFGAIGVFV